MQNNLTSHSTFWKSLFFLIWEHDEKAANLWSFNTIKIEINVAGIHMETFFLYSSRMSLMGCYWIRKDLQKTSTGDEAGNLAVWNLIFQGCWPSFEAHLKFHTHAIISLLNLHNLSFFSIYRARLYHHHHPLYFSFLLILINWALKLNTFCVLFLFVLNLIIIHGYGVTEEFIKSK